MSKELIIFDFFGVISSEVFPIWGKKYFSNSEMDKIRKDIINKGDKGIITEKEMFNKLSKIIGEDSEKILRDWLDTAVINKDVINLIIELRKKYKIVLLSNASSEFIHRILKRIDVNALFDYIVISSEEGIIKPDKKIFDLLLLKMGVSASNAIFIDDNIVNIKGAESAKIDGIVFESIEQLKRDLVFYEISTKKAKTLTIKN